MRTGEAGMKPKPEQERTVNTAWVFDVDGVITNPSEKKVTEPEILDHIIKKLELGEPVVFNTGRSLVWIIDRVINPLLEKVKDRESLQNFLAVGEKGGTWAEFDDQGNLIENKDDNISVPDDLKNEVRNLINNKYSDSIFYDESKLTMISTEMKDGHSLEDYKKKQKMLSCELQEILKDNNLDAKFKVDSTTIATDIENKFVGKRFAIKRIMDWVKKKGVRPQRFIAFGDSFESDVPMAQEIHSQGLTVEFVYVGKENVQTSSFPFPIKRPNTHFEKGTLEFLQTL